MKHSLKHLFTKRNENKFPADNTDSRKNKSANISKICGNYFQSKNYFLLFLLILFFGCTEKKQEGFLLTGELTNATGKTILLEQLSATAGVVVDSVKFEESTGKFSFNGKINHKMFYRLKLSATNFVTFLIDSLDNITIKGDASDLVRNIQIEGSNDSKDLIIINQNILKIRAKMDSLNNIFQESYGEANFAEIKIKLENEFMTIKNKLDALMLEYTNKNPGSLVSLFAVNQLDKNIYMDNYINVADNLLKTLPNSPYVVDFNSRIIEPLKRDVHLAIGKIAPEINLQNPEGELIPLSSLRGKVVLIDFWASWCGPCRKENPNVVKIYKKFHDKGFEIYGVSLDKDKNSWLAAIKQDNISWLQVSDLLAWQSQPVGLYNIQGIPFTVLLDKDGKIVAKGLRGQPLESKIAELLAEEA